MQVKWKNYCVSDTGRIWDCWGNEVPLCKTRVDVGTYSVLRSRFVYEAFQGAELPHNMLVLFKDNNDKNCNISNLYAVSLADYRKESGQNEKSKIFSKEECQTIRDDYYIINNGILSQRDAAIKYNCSLSTIQKILKGTY